MFCPPLKSYWKNPLTPNNAIDNHVWLSEPRLVSALVNIVEIRISTEGSCKMNKAYPFNRLYDPNETEIKEKNSQEPYKTDSNNDIGEGCTS